VVIITVWLTILHSISLQLPDKLAVLEVTGYRVTGDDTFAPSHTHVFAAGFERQRHWCTSRVARIH